MNEPNPDKEGRPMNEYTGRGRKSKAPNTNSSKRGAKHFPFRQAAAYYRSIGWQGTIPVTRWGTKAPLAKGVTGHNGIDATDEELLALIDEFPTANIGIRLPWNIIGIDVDAYDGRSGRDTMIEISRRLECRLPMTYRSTSRAPDDIVSGIYLFRAPRDNKQAWVTDLGAGSGVEIAQFHHRFATVPPSIHNSTGREYKWWYGKHNVPPPGPWELAVLPEEWNAFLLSSREYVSASTSATTQEVTDWYARVSGGKMCRFMRAESDKETVKVLTAVTDGGLHDVLVRAVTHLCMAAAEGHRGLDQALSVIEDGFVTAGRRRNLRSEWRNAVNTAMAKAAALPQEATDICSIQHDWRRTS